MTLKNDQLRKRLIQEGIKMPPGFAEGLADGRYGLPFRASYESMGRAQQQNYERGRLFAINFKAAGLRFPQVAPAFSKSLVRAMQKSVLLAGNPVPRAEVSQ